MERVDGLMIRLYVIASCVIRDFLEEERGDTNFISMLLIIGIAVVLATSFLTIGKDTVDSIGQKITTFIDSLGTGT